jgi:UDP-N-acetylmuramyl pentapeptide phosphotransferase/UDP-N-acetylglucosamine-1-phosphate transferase
MLLALAQWLQNDYGFLRVFNYLTFRAVMASLTALVIGLGFGPWVIRRLTELKVGQAVRSYGPQTHLVKAGTPTMGGVLVLIGIAVSTLLWADWGNASSGSCCWLRSATAPSAGWMTTARSFTVTRRACLRARSSSGRP